MSSKEELDEINKQRVALGLKPIAADSDDEQDDVNTDPLRDQDEVAAKNYRAQKEEAARTKEQEEIRLRLAKFQNRRDLSKKLRGPTLGEASPASSSATTTGGEAADTLKWLKQSQKRAKKIAAQRQKAQEEQDAAALEQYSSTDLSGLRVAHDIDDIGLAAGGQGRVLTLRDSRILDGDEDELMDSTIEQDERDRLNEKRRKGVKAYTGLDDDDDEVGGRSGVLSKYDADLGLDGPTRNTDGGFRLGAEPTESKAQRDEESKQHAARMLNRTLLSLDYSKNQEVSDYLQEGDAGFKRPKTKKKRAATRVKLEADDDAAPAEAAAANDGDSAMQDVKPAPRVPRQITTDNFVDDDELAASLAKARRNKAKRTLNKLTPEEIAKNLAAQREAEEEADSTNDNARSTEASGLTFDDTSEFVRNIQARPSSPGPSARRSAASASKLRMESEERSEARATAPRSRSTSVAPRVKMESEEDGGALVDAAGLLARKASAEEEEGAASDEEMASLDEREVKRERSDSVQSDSAFGVGEQLVSSGMGATLSILRNSGMLETRSAEDKERERQQREYDAWLAKRRTEDALREAERAASKAQGSAIDQATREYENRMREAEDARLALEKFKDYKPDIVIKYHDTHGRELNKHEAWKNLSHVFHGKLPGKKRQELTLRRIEDERKREKMSAGDTPTGMNKAFAERAERSGQAHMVIGVGARNNAPQDLDLLGPNTVDREASSKSKASQGKGKGKAKAVKPKSKEPDSFAKFAALQPRAMGGGPSTSARRQTTAQAESPPAAAPPSLPPPPPPPLPSSSEQSRPATMKPAFAPLKAAPVAAASSTSSSTTSSKPEGQKFKLAFGKRPASDANGEPPSKRR